MPLLIWTGEPGVFVLEDRPYLLLGCDLGGQHPCLLQAWASSKPILFQPAISISFPLVIQSEACD